jgi:hypothetical protein
MNLCTDIDAIVSFMYMFMRSIQKKNLFRFSAALFV